MKPVSLKTCRVEKVDYGNPQHGTALVALLDTYACDPMGGGHPLSDFARANLISALSVRPQAFSVLAFDGSAVDQPWQPVGLVNCFEGFSTFACEPLVNVHDVVVLPAYRGQRVAEKMLDLVAKIARARGACKLTLEVLQGNQAAVNLYKRIGFSYYQLDPMMGQAQFLQKWLS
jgi:ribosomal protein S18 acetylase RimI-like enzyme